MKQISKKTTKRLIVLSLFLLAVIGVTIAYYNNKKDFQNEFRTGKPGVAIHEIFDPADYWVPGEEKSKKAWFSNSGEMDMLLRFKIAVAWEDNIPHPDNEPNQFVTLYWRDSKWEEDENNKGPITLEEARDRKDFDFYYCEEDGYYYYRKVLKAKGSGMEATQNVLESVKFSENLSNDGHENSDYSNVQVNVTIQGETILASTGKEASEAEWSMSPTINGDAVEWTKLETP